MTTYAVGDERCYCHQEPGDVDACPVHERKRDLLKLIADELIVLDQSRERALLAEKRIAAWRDEYDNRT